MGIGRIAKDIFSLGADWRVRKAQAEFDRVCRRLEGELKVLARTRDTVNGKVQNLVETKIHAIESLRIIRKISKNLEAKPRLIAGGEVRTPPIEQLNRIDNTIETADIAKNTLQGLTAGTSAALGAWALVGAYGTASTGTAIVELSGAAASNAILAWLGGGSVAAGGGGIAVGTVVLGGIVLVPAVLIAGVFSHLSANKAIKEIEGLERCVLYDIEQCKKSKLVLNIFGKRVEEVSVSIDKASGTLKTEVDGAYKKLFPYGPLSKLFRYVRGFFGKSYFSEADVLIISQLLRMAQALAALIDQKLLDENGNIL